MRIKGKVTFKEFSKSNHVTIEGARALMGCLTNNSMAYLSNILFITDFSKMSALKSAVANDLSAVTWDDLYNGGDPYYNPQVCLRVTKDENNKKGTIFLKQGDNVDGTITLRASCEIEAGIAPQGGFTIYGMAFILNGRYTTMEEATQSGYQPTEGGEELVFCFVEANTQIYAELDNEFRWDITFDVNQ